MKHLRYCMNITTAILGLPIMLPALFIGILCVLVCRGYEVGVEIGEYLLFEA